ncbi:MAG: D-alanyl-D-alanine carboxypeptidase [Ruminococcus sp.]|nr:D-alanyl-D-alanine carboxypeptidase [Ruminococcus sp.]
MNKLKRTLCCLICAVLMIPCMGAQAFNFTPKRDEDGDGKLEEMTLFSEAVYMEDMNTGEPVVEINADEERSPASLTKIMTAILLLDEFSGDAETMKSTYYSAGSEAFDELYDTGASTADIQPGEEVNCYDLLAALMLPSSCEAANIIALNLSDSINDFCELMNKKAKDLEMNHSHFSNAHGLFTSQNYSSCRDIAKACRYAMTKYPVFAEIVAMPEYTMSPTDFHPEGTDIYNTNLLVSPNYDYYYDTVKGIKTGTLEAAGRCLASCSEQDGITYLTVTMGAPMEKQPAEIAKGEENPGSLYDEDVVYYNLLDHIHLYDWAYSSLVMTDFIDANSELTEAKVAYGDGKDYANLKPKNGFSRLWPSDVKVKDIEKKITVYDNIIAPVKVGDVLGKLELTYKGQKIATIDLVSTTNVERSGVKEKAKIAKSYFGSNVFKITSAIVLVLVSAYIIIHVVIAQKKYLK